jgi:8-oxo-dGTP pyrophosphatase MutT (NUDIX family)
MSAFRRDLARWLDGHRPSDAREAAHLEAMHALLGRPEDVTRRDHFEPGHFTASGFVLSPERDALLLIFHGKLRRWLQPGGHIEPADATIGGAAAREVQEETGLEVSDAPRLLDVDVHEIPPLGASPAHRHFDVRFAWTARHRGITADSDACQARWVPLGEIAEGVSDESVRRAVRKLRVQYE